MMNMVENKKLFDEAAIEKAVTAILKAVGEDPSREGLVNTPKRVAEMYSEIFMGINVDPAEDLKTGFEEGHREMIIIRDIPF
jgi:GTP cyclohydrolase I